MRTDRHTQLSAHLSTRPRFDTSWNLSVKFISRTTFKDIKTESSGNGRSVGVDLEARKNYKAAKKTKFDWLIGFEGQR